jgi:hypothetical protein
VTDKVNALVLPTDESTLDEVSTFVRSAVDAADACKALVLRTADQVANSSNSLKASYDSLPSPPAPALINQLFERSFELLKKFPHWTAHPKEGTKELPEALGALKSQWREALIAQTNGMDEARNSLTDWLDEGNYNTAAFNLITYLREHPPKPGDTILGDTDTSLATSSAPMPLSEGLVSFFNSFSSRAEDDVTMITSVHQHTLPPNLEALRARTWQELATAKALRFAIASLIILAIGYALFVDKFVGTFNDLMAIFVWAFGTNISVDTIMDSTKK